MKTRSMCVRLRSLGLPSPIADEMISAIRRWHRCSGPEWTTKRLKSLKVEFLNRLSGGSYRAPDFARSRAGLPKGVWSWLFRKGLSGQAYMVIQCLMAYSVTVLDRPSKSQREKFLGSMMSTDTTGLGILPNLCHTVVGSTDFNRWPRPLFAAFGSPSKRSPDSEGRSIPQSDLVGHSVAVLPHISRLLSMIEERHNFEASDKVGEVLEMVYPWQELLGVTDLKEPEEFFVGKISLIQEPGCKLRAVANPHFIYQVALEPLKRFLLEHLRTLPTDCTHDQESGKQAIQKWIQEGRMCHSIDLSDATNLFPRNYQIQVLKDLKKGYNDLLWLYEPYGSYVYLFEALASAPWKLPKELGGGVGTFTRGQPLGLAPSFPAFALSHNILCEELCKDLGLRPVDSFRILGDDIVIANDSLASAYRTRLSDLGCKISEDKCLTSTEVAEFGGSIITRYDIIPQFKWREPSWANVYEICRNYGPQGFGFLSKQQKTVVKLLAPLPEMLGGLGWNPQGLPLDQRLRTPTGGYLLDHYLNREEQALVPVIAVKRRASDWEVGITKWLDKVQAESESFLDIKYFGSPLSRPDRGWFKVWLNTHHPRYASLLSVANAPDEGRIPLSPKEVSQGRVTRNGMEYIVRQPDGWSDPRAPRTMFLMAFVSTMIRDYPEMRKPLQGIHRQLFLRRKRLYPPSSGRDPLSSAYRRGSKKQSRRGIH